MCMNQKGFTLVELLAVIIILAIIAVIATPIILNTIENAREGAARDSAVGVINAARETYAEAQLNSSFDANDLTATFPDDLTLGGKEIKLSGEKPSEGTVTIDLSDGTEKITIANLKFGKYYCSGDSDNINNVVSELYQTVYRSNGTSIYIGNEWPANEPKPTSPPAIPVYLKHKLNGNIVANTYVCFTYTGSEICLQGGDVGYHSSNKALLDTVETWFNNKKGSNDACATTGSGTDVGWQCAADGIRYHARTHQNGLVRVGVPKDESNPSSKVHMCSVRSNGWTNCWDASS